MPLQTTNVDTVNSIFVLVSPSVHRRAVSPHQIPIALIRNKIRRLAVNPRILRLIRNVQAHIQHHDEQSRLLLQNGAQQPRFREGVLLRVPPRTWTVHRKQIWLAAIETVTGIVKNGEASSRRQIREQIDRHLELGQFQVAKAEGLEAELLEDSGHFGDVVRRRP